MEHSNLQKSEKGNLASRSLEFTQFKLDKYILTALFIRVTVYSLNPLEKLLFMRGVLFLLPQDGSREWPAEAASTAGSGGAAHGGPSALVQDLVTGRGDLQWPSHARASGRDGKARRWRPEGGSSRLLRARRSGA